MAVYSLLFGHAEWPDEPSRPKRHHTVAVEHERVSRLTLRVPSSLKSRLEESAELSGLTREAFLERALARSVDPRLGS
jgi:siderophore synthetase component